MKFLLASPYISIFDLRFEICFLPLEWSWPWWWVVSKRSSCSVCSGSVMIPEDERRENGHREFMSEGVAHPSSTWIFASSRSRFTPFKLRFQHELPLRFQCSRWAKMYTHRGNRIPSSSLEGKRVTTTPCRWKYRSVLKTGIDYGSVIAGPVTCPWVCEDFEDPKRC